MDCGDEINIVKYFCGVCMNYSSIDESDVYWHIDEEHTKDEIINFVIERSEISIPKGELSGTIQTKL